MVTISKCQTHRDWKRFERIPEILHRTDPLFTPPIPGNTFKTCRPGGLFARHGEIEGFIAWRDGKPVGRIAAIINHSHNRYVQDQTAFFGFFDCENSSETARLLFEAVRDSIRSCGFTLLRGPCSPSTNDECGLLVDGFDSSAFLMMPYNPPYYLKLLEENGFAPARDLYAFYFPATREVPERMLKIIERVKRSTGISLRTIDLKHLDRELDIILDLYNQTLSRNWGFIPIEKEDLAGFADAFKVMADTDLILIAEKEGKAIGFSLALPNIHEFLNPLKKWPHFLRLPKLFWDIKTKRPKEARLMILGVAPEFRGKGIAALFYAETLLRGKQRYTGGELSWVEETNEEIIKGITVMGGYKYKTYRIYESALS